MISNLINSFLKRYINASYEIKGKVRTFFLFCLFLYVILLIFLILLNTLTTRSILEPVNLLVIAYMIVMTICLILLKQGLYNPAVNIVSVMLYIVVFSAGLFTLKYGSGARMISTTLPLLGPVVFAILFCKKKMSIFV